MITALVMLLSLIVGATRAQALKPISVSPDQDRIEITSLGEIYDSRGDSLQLVMASAADSVSGRMTVRAVTPGTNPNWVAFALQNATDKPIERWLTAERYTMFGSGAIWPDLDARRVEAVTPSLGFVPERIASDRADIFRITLEPGQTITYVAELSSERYARVYLWKPLDYELKVRDRQLFNGVLLGFTGLLAVFLTAVFAANHKIIFPSAALVAWCVLAHLTVDFGFFHKLFQLRADDNAIYRAATEAAIAASLVIFLHTFLRLGQAPSLIRMLLGLWIAGQLAFVGVAVVDPRLASTFARLSFVAIGAIGALTTVGLALSGRDRALALVPTWMLFLVWVFGAAVIMTGRLSTDIAASSLVAGLVLIVVLIGFTVTQFAFRSLEPTYGSGNSADQQLTSLAVDGAGAGIFQWHTRRDEIKVSPLVEGVLGLQAGELSCKVPDFLKHLHEADRERLRMVLWSVQERAGASIHTQFRLRHADQSTRWFDLEASSIPGPDPREKRFVGLLRDVTDHRRAHERLVHDAVHCSLTGLPNRELFVDRLRAIMHRAKTDETVRPAILLIDLDNFKSVNATLGLPVADSLLLTIARRLQRHLSSGETLARVGGDQFALLMEAEKDPAEFAREAERVRRAVRAPIKIAGQDVVITASLGIAIYDGEEAGGGDLLREAEIAMYRAKRAGADRIELFRPEMRADVAQHALIEGDLRRVIDKNQLKVLYQPIIYLPTEELAGFEALPRFDHPSLGLVDPLTLGLSEGSDLPAKIMSYVLARATQDAVRWQKELPRQERPLFVSVNISNRALLKPELAREVRQIYEARVMPPGSLRLEVPESAVMDNPEQAHEVLELLRATGADLALDGFGAGYTSLAYLQRFAIDTIKIDSAVIQAAGGGEASGAAMVRSMVALAQELNRKVVALGVEDPVDVAFLRGIGCAYAQGFYYGDPMPDREVLQLLKLVRKSERRLQPRGFLRMTMKRKKIKADTVEATVSAPATESRPARLAKASATSRSSSRRDNGKAGKDSPIANPPVVPGAAPVATVSDTPLGAAPVYPSVPPSVVTSAHVASVADTLLGGAPVYASVPPAEFVPIEHNASAAAPSSWHQPQADYAAPTVAQDHAPQPHAGAFNVTPDLVAIFDPLASLEAEFKSLGGRPPRQPPNLDALSTVFARQLPAERRGNGSEQFPPYAVANTPPHLPTVALANTPDPRPPVVPAAYEMARQPDSQSLRHEAQADMMSALAGAVAAEHAPAPALKPEPLRLPPVTRTRAARPPPDLSKLPPGLAASLSRLSGKPSDKS